jgi:3-(methylthio)propanoyl-CoA dehydrogenase
MDLMGRKMMIHDGAPFEAFKKEICEFCARHQDHRKLGSRVRQLAAAVNQLCGMALTIKSERESDPVQWGCSTYPALLCFGDIISTWRLMDSGIIACTALDQKGKNDFYTGKILQATYFHDTTLPLTLARISTCIRKEREIEEMPINGF